MRSHAERISILLKRSVSFQPVVYHFPASGSMKSASFSAAEMKGHFRWTIVERGVMSQTPQLALLQQLDDTSLFSSKVP